MSCPATFTATARKHVATLDGISSFELEADGSSQLLCHGPSATSRTASTTGHWTTRVAPTTIRRRFVFLRAQKASDVSRVETCPLDNPGPPGSAVQGIVVRFPLR